MSLTKYKTGITILTEDVANSWFGGLYGSSEASGLDVTDPLVAGHVHDGQHADGHAQKIDLGDHVTGRLDGSNIEDNSITPDKLTDFTFDSIWATASNITSNSPGDLANDSLVFGGPALNDDGDPTHDNRLIFDKSNGSFRAGTANSTQWDSRGAGSAAFGLNNLARGNYNLVSGSSNSTATGNSDSSIIGGNSNTISDGGDQAAIIGGSNNTISASGDHSMIIGGNNNAISGTSVSAGIFNGNSHSITDSNGAVILGGFSNVINSSCDYAVVYGQKGSAIMPGQVVLGGPTFPGGGTAAGAAQASDVVVLGTWAATDTSISLTLDGNAPTATNLLYLPTNSSALVKIDYIMRGKQTVNFFGGGVAYAVVGRIGAGVGISDVIELSGTTYRGGVFTDQTFNDNLGTGSIATSNIISMVASGATGGFYISIKLDGDLFGGAATGAGRVVGRVSITQVRYTIP